MFLYSVFYSLFINYILFMFLKISFSNTTRKKRHYIKLLFRGILLLLFLGFNFLNDHIKNFYCVILILMELILILEAIHKYFLNLKNFYIEENDGTEEYFSLTFSLRNTFCILYLYFVIDYLIKNYTSNLFFLSFMKRFLFNFILEGLLLSILASAVFIVMQQLIVYRNNFIIYQGLSYALKGFYKITNNIPYDKQLKIKEIPLQTLHPYKFKHETSSHKVLLTKFLKEDLDYVIKNKNFFISRFSKLELEEVIKKISVIISEEEYDDDLENNIILSNQIYKILEDLRNLKKNPIKYILNNY